MADDLETQMLKRSRLHMFTSLGGVALGVLVIARSAAMGMPLLAPVGILLIPAIGFWSAFRNLRCPACNKLVGLQVSSNYSPMGKTAPKECAGCGAKIFGDEIVKRFWRMAFVVFFGFLLLAIGGTIAAHVF